MNTYIAGLLDEVEKTETSINGSSALQMPKRYSHNSKILDALPIEIDSDEEYDPIKLARQALSIYLKRAVHIDKNRPLGVRKGVVRSNLDKLEETLSYVKQAQEYFDKGRLEMYREGELRILVEDLNRVVSKL